VKKILVTYATLSGSTAEVARTVGDVIAQAGFAVDVLAVDSVDRLAGYDAVVVGGPMILGWDRRARRFLHHYRKELARLPLAVFVTAMSLTRDPDTHVDGVAVTVDPDLATAPAEEGHLTLRERYARLSSYVRPILKAARPARPASLAIFAGRLEYGRLPWWGVLFAMVVLRAPARDRRNWSAIRSWAAGLPAALGLIAAGVGD